VENRSQFVTKGIFPVVSHTATLSKSRLRGHRHCSPRSPFLDNFWIADHSRGMVLV
jgi:hypothetical protein